jgi:hypothetical protein
VSTKRRRIWRPLAIALITGAGGSDVLLALRTCDEVWNSRRGSLDYHLCGIGGELIAELPIVAPANEPLYSWRLADGTMPGFVKQHYDSSQPPAAVRARLAAFLRQSGFSEGVADAEYEWWTNGHSAMGASVRPVTGGSRVEVLHASGSD